ncbi:MAG TPA: hypothetical protein DCW41_06115 [Clostridiales bacterium]|nr:hypothetical protein [Clostridiales bacterium]
MDNNNGSDFQFPSADQPMDANNLPVRRNPAPAPRRAPGELRPEYLDQLKGTENYPARQKPVRAPSQVPVTEETIPVNNIRRDVQRRPAASRPAPSSYKDDYVSPLEKKKKKGSKKKKIALRIVAVVLGLLIGFVLFGLWYRNYLYSKVNFIDSANATFIDESGNVVEIASLTVNTEHEIISNDNIHNFLLIGIDSRSKSYNSTGTGGLSDVNMVLSVDEAAGTIKMISIARDSYAYVPGYSYPMKINAAMSYGGPELLKATVENQLRISIDGYAYVNFYNMAGVIDAVGGVYCDVTSSELGAEGGLNHNLAELNDLAGLPADTDAVYNSGYIWLNGRQAVAYARIRHVGNGDYERSERQVEVLRSLLDQFMALPLTGKAAAIDDILGMISTNVPQEDIDNYALNFLPSLSNVSIEYMQLPIEGCFYSGMYGDEWSIRANWNAMIPYVQEFFYGETTPFDPVTDIPSSPALESCPTDLEIEDMLR